MPIRRSRSDECHNVERRKMVRSDGSNSDNNNSINSSNDNSNHSHSHDRHTRAKKIALAAHLRIPGQTLFGHMVKHAWFFHPHHHQHRDDDVLSVSIEKQQQKTVSFHSLTLSSELHKGVLKITTQEKSERRRYGHHHRVSSETGLLEEDLDRHETRTVQFDQVTIHYHLTILGDSPSTKTGFPLALGEKAIPDMEDGNGGGDEKEGDEKEEAEESDGDDHMSVDAYGTPQAQRAHWPGDDPMVIPAAQRKRMLMQAGVAETELKQYELLQKVRAMPRSQQKCYLERMGLTEKDL